MYERANFVPRSRTTASMNAVWRERVTPAKAAEAVNPLCLCVRRLRTVTPLTPYNCPWDRLAFSVHLSGFSPTPGTAFFRPRSFAPRLLLIPSGIRACRSYLFYSWYFLLLMFTLATYFEVHKRYTKKKNICKSEWPAYHAACNDEYRPLTCPPHRTRLSI